MVADGHVDFLGSLIARRYGMSDTGDADGQHEQPMTLATLPLELLVKVCFAVGSADRASLRMVATTLADAVRDAAHMSRVATARLHTLLRGWTMRVRILESNGACAGCGLRHLGAFSYVCSFCNTPFCGQDCMRAGQSALAPPGCSPHAPLNAKTPWLPL